MLQHSTSPDKAGTPLTSHRDTIESLIFFLFSDKILIKNLSSNHCFPGSHKRSWTNMCMTDLHFTRFLADLLLKIGLGTLIVSQCDYCVRRVVHEHE